MKTLKFLTLALATLALVFTSCVDPTDKVDATGISLDQVTAELSNAGPSVVELTATLTPADATSEITWGTSDPAIATVLASGTNKAIVTATGAGVATITATANGFSAACEVTVTWEAIYPEVAPVAGHLVWVVKFDVPVCDGYDVVFVGTPGWDGDLTRKFTAIDGWTGWYKLDIPIEGAADGDWLISGKPVQVETGGTFDWAYQVGYTTEADVEVLAGNAGISVVAGYSNECDIHFSSINEVIVTRFAKWKNVPCVNVPTHNYTFTVTVPAATEGHVVRIVGDFGHAGYDGWSVTSTGTILTKVDATTYTITLNNVKEGSEYKYVLDGDTAGWDGEELAATAEGADCANAIQNRTTPTSNAVTDVVENWRDVTIPRCSK